jgi:hypothetical protein
MSCSASAPPPLPTSTHFYHISGNQFNKLFHGTGWTLTQKKTITIQFVLDKHNDFQVGYIEAVNDNNNTVNRINMTNASRIILQLIYNNEPFTDDVILAIILNQ